MPPRPSSEAAPLAPGARCVRIGASYALLLAASPGALAKDGLWWLGLVALAPWISAARRPGRWALTLESLLGTLYFAGLLWWIGYIFVPALLIVACGMGVWLALAGWLARALPRGSPCALIGPLAWVGSESARALAPTSLGTGWLQLGHLLVDAAPIAGSARVWGVTGLSVVAAATAGTLLDVAATRGRNRGDWLGLAPLALALVLARATSPPPTEPGPSVLVVQPAFAQARKQYGDPTERLRDALALTREALAELAQAGTPVDLVCWGETLLPLDLAAPGLAEAVAAGASRDPWREPLRASDLHALERWERIVVEEGVFGRTPPNRAPVKPLLPEGASFLAGVECLRPSGERIVRINAAVLWEPDGRRQPPAAKRYLVPGGETMWGLERLEPVRTVILQVAGYVPDLAEGEETGVLELPTAGGHRYRLGASVCFDNAFDAPYAEPAAGALDFHVVLSNEAWYRGSFELDQMVAFSRLMAIATGRSFVRVTNSGISLVLDPSGRELDRVEKEGRDREVAGWLCLRVPVPVPAALDHPTPYARTWRVWPWLAALAPWLWLTACALRGLRSDVPRPGGRGGNKEGDGG